MVMKYLSILLLSVILLTSCNSPTCSCNEEGGDAPKLKVTNNACMSISSVSLVGYDFQNLAIGENESKTFTLADGLPAGLDDVNVNVGVISSTRGFSGDISVDFTAGQTSGIKLVKVKFLNECNAQYFGLELDE
jgi:hypothetical protein